MESKETIIYTMPERFFTPPKKGLPSTTVFFIAAGALFAVVVGGATWYFTRGLRASPSAAPAVPPVAVMPPAAGPATEAEVPVSAQPSAAPIVPEQPPVASPETVFPRAEDSDADGLTAAEEAIFKTSPTQPDSDSDGYLDGHEVINLYNPAGTAPERLEAAGLAVPYRSLLFGYEFLHPSAWKAESADPDGREIILQTGGAETISVEARDNPSGLSLAEWYRVNVSGVSPALREIVSRSGARGLATPNGLNAYFAGKGVVYILTYRPGAEAVLNFPRAFDLMQISFRVMP